MAKDAPEWVGPRDQESWGATTWWDKLEVFGMFAVFLLIAGMAFLGPYETQILIGEISNFISPMFHNIVGPIFFESLKFGPVAILTKIIVVLIGIVFIAGCLYASLIISASIPAMFLLALSRGYRFLASKIKS